MWSVHNRAQVAADDAQPLDFQVRNTLESTLRAELSAVRVHTGPAADQLTGALAADAFTCGPDIFFRRGAFRPDAPSGLRLLAHEVAHALQQSRGPVGGHPVGGWTVSIPGDPWEQEADRCAGRVVAGEAIAQPIHTEVAAPASSNAIQRHVSFEHRLLGDGPTADLVAIAANGASRNAILDNQIALLELWQNDPATVTEADIQKLCPWIRTIRLAPGNILATYGELNALPDYLANAQAFDSV
ncbi:MAG TPA: DUF4157 domain-containing protein, partial [Actinomycetota bacterium]|nr:DUF4157 domain-containing protein [Actinomycetota bacterium]